MVPCIPRRCSALRRVATRLSSSALSVLVVGGLLYLLVEVSPWSQETSDGYGTSIV